MRQAASFKSKLIVLNRIHSFTSFTHLLVRCSYHYNVDFHLKWSKFEQAALLEAKLHHSSSSNPAAGENIHPAFKKYIDLRTAYEDLYPSQSVAADKNRKACKAVEEAVGIRRPGVTGELLFEVKGDYRKDYLLENASAVQGGTADEPIEMEMQVDIMEVSGTKKKRKRRKGKYITTSMNDFDERKSKLFDIMEGFLTKGGEDTQQNKDPNRPYSALSLDELQKKIEEQEKKLVGTSPIVKKIATKILHDLNEEANKRL